MDPNPYTSMILDHVLAHGDEMRVLVPMQAGVFVELMGRGERVLLKRIAFDFAARERARNKADFNHRMGRDFVFAVSTEVNEAAAEEATAFEMRCLADALGGQEEDARRSKRQRTSSNTVLSR